MIDELDVSGMGGILEAKLQFTGNFIVITGESGSGKSSLVRAFEFIAGKRAQVTAIYGGAEAVTVRSLIQDTNIGNTQESFNDRSLLIERQLSRNGKGKCRVQGVLVTVAELSETLKNKIGIQSQFTQLTLLDPQKQMDLVDSCGGDELADVKKKLQLAFSAVLNSEKELLQMRNTCNEFTKKYEGVEGILSEIDKLSPTEESEREWEHELQRIEVDLNCLEKINRMIHQLGGSGTGSGIVDALETVCRDLPSVAPRKMLSEWMHWGDAALSNLQLLHDAVTRLRVAIKDRNYAELRETIEERLGLLRKLKRVTNSHNVTQLIEYARCAKDDLIWLRQSGMLIEAKNINTVELRKDVKRLVLLLREKRQDAAAKLENRICLHLKDLGMEDSVFSIQIIPQEKVRACGAESVQFTIARKDLPPVPVAKSASGGELSRILVALQASIDAQDLPHTLVFDEVEAGLGGRTALLTAMKLKELSKNCQIILITHEATIAAIADQHFLVKRHEGNETSVQEIRGDSRVAEIARMLAGKETPEAMDHARALLFDQGRI